MPILLHSQRPNSLWVKGAVWFYTRREISSNVNSKWKILRGGGLLILTLKNVRCLLKYSRQQVLNKLKLPLTKDSLSTFVRVWNAMDVQITLITIFCNWPLTWCNFFFWQKVINKENTNPACNMASEMRSKPNSIHEMCCLYFGANTGTNYYYSQALIVQDGPLASLFGVSWSHVQDTR
jgi:hypothetical protein